MPDLRLRKSVDGGSTLFARIEVVKNLRLQDMSLRKVLGWSL